MSISYTDNFNFPLLEFGSDGWDAVMNGMLIDLDLALAEARNPLIWEDDGSDYVLTDVPSGKKATTEVLTFDGDVLFYV